MSRTGTRILRASAVAIAAIAFSAGSSTPAQAAIGCIDTSPSNRFDGYGSVAPGPLPGGTYEGITAGISSRFGAICDTASHDPQVAFNTSWIMVAANQSLGSNQGYAQVGYIRGWGGLPYYFSEYKRGAGDTFHRTIYYSFGSIPYNTGHNFTVGYDPSTTALWMTVDTTSVDHTPWDPYAANAFYPYGYGPMVTETVGETTYLGTDIPGSAGAPTTYSSIAVQTWNGHAWTTTLPAYFSVLSEPRYHLSSMVGRVFSIWI